MCMQAAKALVSLLTCPGLPEFLLLDNTVVFWLIYNLFYSCVFSGTCFDVENNVMWCCSSDWVDQFCNPGHQAPHHVKARLGISQSSLAGSSGKSLFYRFIKSWAKVFRILRFTFHRNTNIHLKSLKVFYPFDLTLYLI